MRVICRPGGRDDFPPSVSAHAGPLEEYAAPFDDLFVSLAQRRGFRKYLTRLLAPRDRNKTITCLAGAEPVVGAGGAVVQRLQLFLSEAAWDADRVNGRRLELLRMQQATALHAGGVIVINDSGDRKDGTATAHVGRQWLGRLGKTDNGIVTVTTVWTYGQIYYPLHAQPYTPVHHFPRGRAIPASAPSRRSPPPSRCAARKRASPAWPWWPTAPTPPATTGISPCATPDCPTSSRSSRTPAPQPQPVAALKAPPVTPSDSVEVGRSRHHESPATTRRTPENPTTAEPCHAHWQASNRNHHSYAISPAPPPEAKRQG